MNCTTSTWLILNNQKIRKMGCTILNMLLYNDNLIGLVILVKLLWLLFLTSFLYSYLGKRILPDARFFLNSSRWTTCSAGAIFVILLLRTRLWWAVPSLVLLNIHVWVIIRHFICRAGVHTRALRYMLFYHIRIFIGCVLNLLIMIIPIKQRLHTLTSK